MPAGNDFICKNEECEHQGKGVVLTAPWPMGEIDKVVDTVDSKALREGIVKLKDEGREYACITYPNVDKIDTVAYRVHKWCPNCPCLWSYDAIIQGENEPLEETLEKAELTEKCPKCETELMDFHEVMEEGIKCPYCKDDMRRSAWFSNETTEAETRAEAKEEI